MSQPTAEAPSVVYVLPAKQGGVTSLASNLLAHRRPDGFRYEVVWTHQLLDGESGFRVPMDADVATTVQHRLSLENASAVFNRLLKAIGSGPGVLVASDELELHACHLRDPGKAVVQIIHGCYDYYFKMAQKHDRVVDAFIAISREIERRLKALMPHRAADIYYLPFGVPVPDSFRVEDATDRPLRLIYAGRMWHEQKGVFDLPVIDAELAARQIPVHWTIIGDGPDFAELQSRWLHRDRATFLGARPAANVLELLPKHDVFVLPTRMEGFPVALMEAMSAGLAPVVSDIASGVPEIVDVTTGFRPPVGNTSAFADAIENLHRRRDLLNRIGAEARKKIATGFDLRQRVADYQTLFARYSELKRPRPHRFTPPYGSRLDRVGLPNALVVGYRRMARLAKACFRLNPQIVNRGTAGK